MPCKQKNTVLIAGGSGLVGNHLTNTLTRSGYIVSHLSRTNKETNRPIKTWQWNPAENYIHPEALLNQDYIINLSGAGIADKFWTKKRKQVILNSRLQSTSLLVDQIIKLRIKPKKFISASAIGYYGDQPNVLLSEESSVGADFLASVCEKWESALHPLDIHNISTAIVRIGIVLTKNGGFLSNLLLPLKYHLNTVPGSGMQRLNWIHIEDLINIFKSIIEGQLPDKIYNAVAPQKVSFIEFQQKLCQITNSNVFELRINKHLLKFLLGDFSSLSLNRQDISSFKLLKQNYSFLHNNIDKALSNLINKDA